MANVVMFDPCSYCGRLYDHWRPRMGMDHIEPVSVGGARDDTNITAVCQFCNSSKGTQSLLGFLLYRNAHGHPNYPEQLAIDAEKFTVQSCV